MADRFRLDIEWAKLELKQGETVRKLYDRMISTMLNKLGYCRTCAQKTIEYFCTQEDET